MKRTLLALSLLLSLSALAQPHLYLKAHDAWHDAGDVFDVTLRIHDGFDSLTAFQFCKKFDQSKISFISVTPGHDIPGYSLGDFGLWNLDTGSVRTLWTDPYSSTVPDDTTFLTFRFVALQEVLLSDALSLDETHPVLPPRSWSWPIVGGDLDFFWDADALTGTEDIPAPVVSVFPNPAQCGGFVTVTAAGLPASAALYDASGRIVSFADLDGRIEMPLAPGAYFLRTEQRVFTVLAR